MERTLSSSTRLSARETARCCAERVVAVRRRSVVSRSCISLLRVPTGRFSSCGATARGTYGTPEAGTRTAHVQ